MKFRDCTISKAIADTSFEIPELAHSNTTIELMSEEDVKGLFTVADEACPIPYYDFKIKDGVVTDDMKLKFKLDERESAGNVSLLADLTEFVAENPQPDDLVYNFSF